MTFFIFITFCFSVMALVDNYKCSLQIRRLKRELMAEKRRVMNAPAITKVQLPSFVKSK